MSTYRFSNLLRPQRIAVVGASVKPHSLGHALLRNVREAAPAGVVDAVNPKYRDVDGVPCWTRLTDLPLPPDLVVIATPPHAVERVVRDSVKVGAKAAIILTAGLGRGPGSIADSVRAIARNAGLRLVGPNCLGVLSPAAGLNASFAARAPAAGRLALISQSGAVAAGVIEWAVERGVGFSSIISLGDAIDVDFGDCLDYFAEDPMTGAILLYAEALTNAPKFMSAARAAARVKPVIVIKAGRHAPAAKAAATHTGALAGADAIYDAAFRRAGLIRARDLDELFAAAETLARQSPFQGDRLAIVTNGGGLGVLAVDRLMDLGGALAELSPDTLARLDKALPQTWSRANPIDIIGDAPPDRYVAAVEAAFEDPTVDAVLAINCPTAVASSRDAADAVIDVVKNRKATREARRPLFSVWLGADAAQRAAFEANGVPTYATEADAVRGFMHVVEYRRRLDELTRTPEAVSRIDPDRLEARAAIAQALRDERAWLSPSETARVLHAYGLPLAPVSVASNSNEASTLAAPYLAAGGACVVKINSPDITHKSDVGGVRLGLRTVSAVVEATDAIIARARRQRPDAKIEGVTIHPMINKSNARELIVGAAIDPTFGPVVMFGQGGVAVEVLKDAALDLLPIDFTQARALIERTAAARLLKAYRDIPAANVDAIAAVMVRLSRLLEDTPEIVGVDLNPILADDAGALILDARVQIAEASCLIRKQPWRRFAVRPYPREWEREALLHDKTPVRIRPIKPEDERGLKDMLQQTSPEDLRLRFLAATKSFDHAFLARLTQLDYARAMAFVALDQSGAILSVARLHGDANRETAEFAILVRTDCKKQGLGWTLMNAILDYAKAEGYREVFGAVLTENRSMLKMCEELGFCTDPISPDPSLRTVRLALNDRSPTPVSTASLSEVK